MDLLCQFQADVLGVTVRRPVVRETTALGAAFLAGHRRGRVVVTRRRPRAPGRRTPRSPRARSPTSSAAGPSGTAASTAPAAGPTDA